MRETWTAESLLNVNNAILYEEKMTTIVLVSFELFGMNVADVDTDIPKT